MGFKNSHPIVHLLYFTSVIAGLLLFRHPIYLALSLVSALVYTLLESRGRAWRLGVILAPAIVLYAIYYASYHHFGVTVLAENTIGNAITTESCIYGLVLGATVGSLVLWIYLIHRIITMDEVGYLLGRISPGVSLVFSIFLRMLSRITAQRNRIIEARSGIGKGVRQGRWWQWIYNRISIFSILLTWVLETLPAMADAMKSRGKELRGRSSYSLYLLDDRDRLQIVYLATMLVVTGMAHALGQTKAVYDPEIYIPQRLALTPWFHLAYAGLCLMPALLDVLTAWRFAYGRRNVKERNCDEK